MKNMIWIALALAVGFVLYKKLGTASASGSTVSVSTGEAGGVDHGLVALPSPTPNPSPAPSPQPVYSNPLQTQPVGQPRQANIGGTQVWIPYDANNTLMRNVKTGQQTWIPNEVVSAYLAGGEWVRV